MRPLHLARGLAATLVLLAPASAARAGDGSWVWPVPPDGFVTAQARFAPPATEYAAGHRGVDLRAPVGTPVRAVAAGVVTFAGQVAGVGVVSIDHGAERSTYQPVAATVEVGTRVAGGDVIGTVTVGRFHCESPCVHLGRIAQENDAYLDPLDRLPTPSRVRLVDPDGPPPVPPAGSTGLGLLRRPVAGPVTSPFGPRLHPTTHRESTHDGVDFGAPCGAAVHAAAPGTVARVGRAGAYGLRVVVRHPSGLETTYGHLARASVDRGDRVTVRTVVGRVGSSGLSTGCHLHLGVRRDGEPLDPLSLL